MPRESQTDKSTRAIAVLERLDHAMPEAKIELDYQTPLELLVAVILSAQCTDRRVNMATPALFKDFPTAAHYANATPRRIEGYIKTLGLYRNKAKSLNALGQALVTLNQLPALRADLEQLPGVGKKTAGVVAIHLGTDTAFPVDTHILRLAYRLGFSTHDHPDKVEADLRKLLPAEWWFKGHQLLIWHGRRVCHAARPECERCTVNALCPKKGVKRTRLAARLKPARP